jgi:MFS family permease
VEAGAHGTGLGRYAALLREPYVAPLLGWGIVARFSLGMTPLALLLLVRSQGGSYAAAGAVAATYSVAVGVGAPVAGRQVDTRGPLWAMLPRGIAYPALLAVAAVLGLTGAPTAALGVVAALAGASMPPVGSSVRTLLPEIAPPELRSTIFALEASLQEVFFIGGPLLVALLATIAPSAALIGAAVTTCVGTLALIRLEPMRAVERHEIGGRTWVGALAAPGVRTFVTLAVFMGLGFGAVEVSMPAFAELHATRAQGGLALACFSAGSLFGGLVTGLRHGIDNRRQLLTFALVLPAGLALPLLAGSLPVMCALVFLAGLPIAPLITGAYGLVERIAPAGTHAETFAWFGTAVTAGIASGTSLGGWLVDDRGVRASILLGVIAAAVAALVVTARRGTLGEDEPRLAPTATGGRA